MEQIASRRIANNYLRVNPGFLERGFIFIGIKVFMVGVRFADFNLLFIKCMFMIFKILL